MHMQMLAIVAHPTILPAPATSQPFHGWGVRIG